MGAPKFIPPQIVVRWVVPTPTDPVVVARGGMAGIAQRRENGLSVIIDHVADRLEATGFDPKRIEEARQFCQQSRWSADVRLASARQTKADRAAAMVA